MKILCEKAISAFTQRYPDESRPLMLLVSVNEESIAKLSITYYGATVSTILENMVDSVSMTNTDKISSYLLLEEFQVVA